MSTVIADSSSYLEFVHRYIQRFAPMQDEHFRMLSPYIEVRSVKKKEIILKQGEVDNYLNLVVKGIVRKYLVSGKKEKTVQLATEGHLIQSEISFHRRVPSDVELEALEPTVLVSMHYENILLALKTIPGGEEIARGIISYMFIKKDQRSYMRLKLPVRQRFLQYLQQHPHMLQRVPQKILASYLDIKPETFSRLKHLVGKGEGSEKKVTDESL
jgi:CRP-like cAMP-binding protein